MCRIWRCMAEVAREIGWDFRGAVWNYCYCVCSHHRHIFAWYHSASMAPFLSRAYFEAFGNGGEGTLVEDMCNAAFLQVLLSLPRGCRAVISAKNVSVDTHPLGIRLCSRWHVAFACTCTCSRSIPSKYRSYFCFHLHAPCNTSGYSASLSENRRFRQFSESEAGDPQKLPRRILSMLGSFIMSLPICMQHAMPRARM